jgi:parallel beta-helix repeat protein
MHLKGNEKCGNGIHAYYVNEISLREMWIDYHGKSGIFLDYCYENPRVCNNNIAYNKENGVLINGCHDIVVSANQFEENGIGVYAKNIFNATITGNDIDDHIKYSIQFENAYGSIITGNMLEESAEECIVLNKSDGIVVTGNTLRNAGKKLLHIVNTNGVTVSGNVFDGSYGNAIDIENNSKTISISGNILSSHPAWDRIYGILMKDVYDVSITGNTIIKPLEGGIYILGSENKYINISGNTIKNPSYKNPKEFSGILIHNTFHSIISNNIVINDIETKIMKSAIEETGNSDYNLIMNNRVNKGTKGDMTIIGKNTKKEGNFIY